MINFAKSLIAGGNGLMALGCLLLLLPIVGFILFAVFVALGTTGSVVLLMVLGGIVAFGLAGQS